MGRESGSSQTCQQGSGVGGEDPAAALASTMLSTPPLPPSEALPQAQVAMERSLWAGAGSCREVAPGLEARMELQRWGRACVSERGVG